VSTFVRYTLARLALFVVAFGLTWLVCFSFLEWTSVTALWTVLIALVVSSLASLVLLRHLRDELASVVAQRADRVSAKIEESRRAEDVD
jgi:ABC-type bacteriocin/lantibiotic exporter with double-glycine peptidase domain